MIKQIGSVVSPTVVVYLTVLWLVLQQTIAPEQVVLGVVLAILLAWASSKLRPVRAPLRRRDCSLEHRSGPSGAQSRAP